MIWLAAVLLSVVLDVALEQAPAGRTTYAVWTNCWTDEVPPLKPFAEPVPGTEAVVEFVKGMPRAFLSVIWAAEAQKDLPCSCTDADGVKHPQPCGELSMGSVSTVMAPECQTREAQCEKSWACGTGRAGGSCGGCDDGLVCISHACVEPPKPEEPPPGGGSEEIKNLIEDEGDLRIR